MKINNLLRLISLILLGLSCGRFSFAQSVTTFNDIQYWIGEGSNEAVLVIDWSDLSSADESLAWGYRWNGTATGEDMLLDILAVDQRLFSKLNSIPGLGLVVFGWGYDLNNDGSFGTTDGTSFNADGIALSGVPDDPPPAAASADPNDQYAEGWLTGFWNYSNSLGNPFDGGSWVTSELGATSRTLSDGDWDSWGFSTSCDPMCNLSAFAENPVAAEAPITADFDGDTNVDGSDFLSWARGHGITSGALHSQGDATGDGAVNDLDLENWFAEFGQGTSSSLSTSISIPEPANLLLAQSALIFYMTTILTRRQANAN